jgi:zinc D-Ala-D-Ala carboxypeptidase
MIVELIKFLLTSATTGSTSNSKKVPLVSSTPEVIDEYYRWDKGQDLALSPYFSSREMSCHCSYPDCKKQMISKSLIGKLGTIRKEIGQPLIVTSAYRCTKYQEFLRAAGVNTVVAKLSQHELGNAADVVPKDGKMEGFEGVCSKEFDSIGLAKSFLHLDLRIGKRRWIY